MQNRRITALIGRVVALAAIVGAVSLRAVAQPMRATPAERAKMLKERLTLSDEQTKKVQAIYEASTAELEKVREQHQGDRDAMRKAVAPIMEKTDKEIEAILTKEQKKEYDKFKEERRQRMQQMGPPPGS